MRKLLSFILALTLAVVAFIPLLPTPVQAAEFTYRVGASSDDCYRRLYGSYWDISNPNQMAGAYGSDDYQRGGGMRFTNIAIAKDTIIVEAYLVLTCSLSASTLGVKTRISASDEDDAATFSTSGDFDARWAARTTARVDWDDIPSWTANTEYTSPDIKTVIQEIVNRAGWTSGNDIVIFWDDFDDRSGHSSRLRQAYSYNNNPAKAPQLLVTTRATPAITTEAATNIAITTARLNSTLAEDGGESCNVSFQYHYNIASDNFSNCDNTTWVTGFTTGERPFADLTGLTYDTQYHFRARVQNIYASSTGGVLSFTTEALLNEPTDFKAFPETTSVAFSWTSGAGSSQTLVRYKPDAYAENITQGIQIYLGTLNSCEHTGLSSGTTGFYSAWGKSSDNYSDDYAMVIATTLGAPTAVAEPDAPTMPTGWFQATDYTKFSAFPLYPFLNNFADALPMPRNTFWFLLGIMLCAFAGLLVLGASKSGTVTMIVLAASVGLLSGVALLPRFMFAFVVLFLIGAWQFRHQGGRIG